MPFAKLIVVHRDSAHAGCVRLRAYLEQRIREALGFGAEAPF